MFFMDPTLYGTTLPQRDIPVPPTFANPFFGQNLPLQAPWQNLPLQAPWQNLPLQAPWQNLPLQAPWQNLPVQGLLPWQYLSKPWFPPVVQQGITPFVPQPYGYTPPAMTTPFPPTALSPYMHGCIPQTPFFGLQRPYPY